jgi:3-hydroxyanthranilate 3,4-dioxygenase
MSSIEIRRKNQLNLFREKAKYHDYDEAPLLKEDVDPQLHASLNTVDQPFYLICEKDTVLAAVSGSAKVVFRDASIRYFELGPGDHVYVPGGIPHRIECSQESLHLRYKARVSGLEAIAWFCESCGNEVDRYTWDNAKQSPQAGYRIGSNRFNADASRRVCSHCGVAHAPLDLTRFRWDQFPDISA